MVLSLLTGASPGFPGGRIRTWRRVQMLLWSVAVYWFGALLAVSLFMVSLDEPGVSLLESLARAVVFSFAGALMYSLVLLPAVMAVALIVERWTREDVAPAAPPARQAVP